MSDIDPQKLKVVELRAELSSRGLDTKGNKAVLVKRLQKALNQERGEAQSKGEEEEQEEDLSQTDQEILDTSQESITNEPAEKKAEPVKEKPKESEPMVIEQKEEEKVVAPAVVEAEPKSPPAEPEVSKMVTETEEPTVVKVEKDPAKDQIPEDGGDESEIEDTVNGNIDKVEIKEEPSEAEEAQVSSKEPQPEIKMEPQDEVKEEVKEDERVEDKVRPMDSDHHHHRREKRRHSQSPSSDRRRHRSRSDSVDKRRSRSRSPPRQEPEEEPFDETIVALDTFDADLNMTIDKTRYLAIPFTEDGFGLMWAGVRALYGFKTEKVCFEVKILKQMDISHLPSEPDPHVVRVGYSVCDSTLQLGEDPLSYGYGGTGKASTNCQFKDYGAKFGEGDVIGCFADMTNDNILISFAKNGDFQGIAYSVPKEQLGEKAFFPHILTKNCSFEVNFGQRENPYFPLPENFHDYVFAACISPESRFRGRIAPATKADCEMIMMCGLPGSGKSTWAANYCAQNREKYYYVLGTNNIIDKMKVMGLPRKRNYAGRWDVLIEKSTKCLNKLFEVASRLKRNFILDQTNVYATAQRRKMRPFEGFKRRAVVLVPTDEEFKRRIAKREKDEGKDVPESAVLEMKANFILPEVGPVFDAVEFAELPESETRPLVDTYRREARSALPPPEKRMRPADRGPQDRGSGGRYPVGSIVSRDRDRGRMDDRRYPPNRGNYNSGMRGGPPNNNYSYRDNRNMRGGGGNYNRGPNMGRPMNRSGPPNRQGRGPPQQGHRNSYSGYNSRDRGYQQSSKQDYVRKKSGQSQGAYGQSTYGSGGTGSSSGSGYGGSQNYNYQGYGYGQQGYGQQQQQQQQSSYGQQQQGQQQTQQWKQPQSSYGGAYSSSYAQPAAYSQQPQQSGYAQQSQQSQQPATQSASQQAYYNQQYYNQQWSQWNQQNQQYYNQYYPYYGQQGYGGYQQSSAATPQQQQPQQK